MPPRPRRPPRSARVRAWLGVAILLFVLACGAEPPPVAVLITVDTLRADALGHHGNPHDQTPRLDALAKQSVTFESAYAPASVTLPSLASLLTGRYPEQLGVWNNASQLAHDASTLATALRSRGFATGAAVGSQVLLAGHGLEGGFDVYDDALPDREVVRQWWERTAAPQTAAGLDVLDTLLARDADGIFLWVHYQDPHGPYTPPDPPQEAILSRELSAAEGARELPLQPSHYDLGRLPQYQALGDERRVGFYRAQYAGEVGHLDRHLGAFLDGLQERGLEERTLLVFTADHGESLGEDDYWFAHGELLSDALVRVPLFIRHPGLAPARRDDVASHVDLFPTVLTRLGLPLPDADDGLAPRPGRDLLAPGAEAASAEVLLATLGGSRERRVGLVGRSYKVVATERRGRWEPTVFRRTPLGEPERAVDSAPLRREWLSNLSRARRALGPFPPERPRRLSDAEREQLRALGYEIPAAAEPPEDDAP